MANLQSFDPSFYLFGTNDMCEALENRDYLDTKSLVKSLYETLVDTQNKLHQGIFSILTETGEGKTFFLALLYCLLKKNHHKVHYVDILHYVIQDNEEKMMEDIQALCMPDSAIVILIDNLEKYSPRFTLDFIYRINALVRQENILCVLFYDEKVLFKKINLVYNENDKSMQTYFQNFIDIEYFLMNKKADSNAMNEIFYGISPYVISILESVFKKLDLTIREKNIIAKKVRFYIQNHEKEQKSILEYLPFVFYLTILKLREKEKYRKLLSNLPQSEEELPLYEEVLSPMMEERKTMLTTQEGYEDVERKSNNHQKPLLETVQDILFKMELVNV